MESRSQPELYDRKPIFDFKKYVQPIRKNYLAKGQKAQAKNEKQGELIEFFNQWTNTGQIKIDVGDSQDMGIKI